MSILLIDKIVIVIGGVSGIGCVIVELFVEYGVKVVIVDCNEE